MAPSRVVGRWLRSCDCAYISAGNGVASRILEVATSVEPDSRGELVCDLFDVVDGVRVNPDGVKGLMGTLNGARGTIVVNQAGFGKFARVLGRVDAKGVLFKGQREFDGELEIVPWGVDDLRWLEIGIRSDGMTAFRSVENGFWGFVDESGAVAIEARYADVCRFDGGMVAVLDVGSNLWGLINKNGDWVAQPKWLCIDRVAHDLSVVESVDHCWGAIDDRGGIRLDLRPWSQWVKSIDADGSCSECQKTTDEREREILTWRRPDIVDALYLLMFPKVESLP